MPGWLSDLLITLVGAFAGVLAGLQADRWLAERRTKARRDGLVAVLRQEIEAYTLETSRRTRLVQTMSNWQPTLYIGAIDTLLNSDTLDAREDALLIGLLVRLKKHSQELDAFSWLINANEYWAQGDYESRAANRDRALTMYERWLARRDQVIDELNRKGYGSRAKLPPFPEERPPATIYGPDNPPESSQTAPPASEAPQQESS